ncbi:MAG TPA: 4-hydroxy-tetrahydrodipicolinate reductase [Actinomycetota bacterium]
MTRVAVLGAFGKMGRAVVEAVRDADGLELVAAVDPSHAGERLEGLEVVGSLEAVAGAEVAVDFTRPDAVLANLEVCLARGIHAVVGTTGISPDDHERIAAWCAAGGANAIVAPNFSVGAVLSQRLAELAAPHFPAVEVIELHHDQKVDAPSGTAAATARRIAAARKESWAGPDAESVPGVRGGAVDGVRVHSVRLPGLVAHQEILFGGLGQTLSIRHDTTDRTSFMPGVLLAIAQVASRPGLTVGLEPLLGL